MFENKYPYTDFHEMNLDWILEQMKKVLSEFDAFRIAKTLKFANPIIWSKSIHYKESTIVQAPNGDTYLSLKEVPTGILLDNTEYWVKIWSFSAQLELMKEDYRPAYVFLKESGSDENSGLSLDDAMRTPEAAYRKYANHKYINLLIYESGNYNFGEGLEYGQEFLMAGHCSVIAGYVPDIHLTGNIYWLSGNLEFWDVIVDAWCSLRCSGLAIKNTIFNNDLFIKAPFVFTNCTFNKYINISQNGEFRSCTFNDTIDRSKILVSNSTISFSRSININTDVEGSTKFFVQAYSGSNVIFTVAPTFGEHKYLHNVWANASCVTCASNAIYKALMINALASDVNNPRGLLLFNSSTLIASNNPSVGVLPTEQIEYQKSLNEIKTPGRYKVHPGAVDKPVNVACILEVSDGMGVYLQQKIDVINNGDIEFYIRKFDAYHDTWTPWYKFTGTQM